MDFSLVGLKCVWVSLKWVRIQFLTELGLYIIFIIGLLPRGPGQTMCPQRYMRGEIVASILEELMAVERGV